MRDLSQKAGTTIQPVFIRKKLGQDLNRKEIKPPIANQQRVVYVFSCDICHADYVGYTARHLRQRLGEHKTSATKKQLLEAHGDTSLHNETQYRILLNCRGKFDCTHNLGKNQCNI